MPPTAKQRFAELWLPPSVLQPSTEPRNRLRTCENWLENYDHRGLIIIDMVIILDGYGDHL